MLFAKRPEAGRSKTRLADTLGPERAAILYEAFLDDTVALCRRVDVAELELWIDGGADALKYFESRYPDVPIRRQRGEDLGARLRTAFQDAFERGANYAVATGSDHPTLPPSYLDRAFRALIGAHLVIGPSSDGGYYALGLRRYAWPRASGLFRDIPWSTDRVLDRTREAALALDLCHVELPVWYDVDEPADLARLARDVDAGSRTAPALRQAIGSSRD